MFYYEVCIIDNGLDGIILGQSDFWPTDARCYFCQY